MLDRRNFSKLLASIVCFPKDIFASIFMKDEYPDCITIENVSIPIIRYYGLFETDWVNFVCSDGYEFIGGPFINEPSLDALSKDERLKSQIRWHKGNAFRFTIVIDNNGICGVSCTAPHPIVKCVKAGSKTWFGHVHTPDHWKFSMKRKELQTKIMRFKD